MKYIYWLKDAFESDISVVGYKAWALSKLLGNGFLVPNGFILSSDFVSRWLEARGILAKIQDLCSSLNSGVDASEVSFAIGDLLLAQGFDGEIAEDVLDHYEILGAMGNSSKKGMGGVAEELVGGSEAQVAVRLSSEDKVGSGFAKLGVSGAKDLFEAIRSQLIVYYSAENLGIHKGARLPAVLVQEMLSSSKSGVLFTEHPVTGEKGSSVIEAVHGLGLTLYEEEIAADSYVVSHEPRQVVSREVDEQLEGLYHEQGSIVRRSVSEFDQKSQTLTDRECTEVTRNGQRAKGVLGGSASLRFGIVGEDIHVLSASPLENGPSVRKGSVESNEEEVATFATNVPEKAMQLNAMISSGNSDSSEELDDESDESDLNEEGDEELDDDEEPSVDDDIPPIEIDEEDEDFEDERDQDDEESSEPSDEGKQASEVESSPMQVSVVRQDASALGMVGDVGGDEDSDSSDPASEGPGPATISAEDNGSSRENGDSARQKIPKYPKFSKKQKFGKFGKFMKRR